MPDPEPDPSTPTGRWLPWRSAALGWLVATAALAAGVPLFLRMPLWCDATLYQVAARNVLEGGVHYRDVFDTNPPGFVWLVCGVWAALGPSSEALRSVDLAIVALITLLLVRWAARAGAGLAARAWLVAGVAAFYPFVSEFCHIQRDVWMMAPALAAILYRLHRVEAARQRPVTDAWVFRSGFLEGVVWTVGFWVKPHVVVPAAAAWLAGAARFAGTSGRPVRRLAADLAGVFAGWLIVVGTGVGWLISTGTWPYFVDVFTEWNARYFEMISAELRFRLGAEFNYFPPWSAFLAGALPLAVLNLLDARVWARNPVLNPGRVGGLLPPRPPDPEADGRQRFARAVLAAVLLGWAAMALFFQRGFHYAHIPEILLMLALFAANRWAVVFAVLCLQVAASLFFLARPDLLPWHRAMRDDSPAYQAWVERHPAFDPVRMRWWPGCFARFAPRELRRGLAFQPEHFGGGDPVDLGAVEDFLRTQGVANRDVICWHNTTHPLYLTLNLRPPIRFMHLSTAVEIAPWTYQQVKEELFRATPQARFVVSDLHRVTRHFDRLNDLAEDGLPHVIPAWQRQQFPFNQPVVFRSPSGRYLVHAIRKPAEQWDCKIPIGLDDPEGW
jgi:hypothetical protein